MALIKSISEVKTLLPGMTSQLSATSALPNFLKAEAKYLVPLTGQALYDDIHTKYNADPASTLAGAEIILHAKMQLLVACGGYLDELAFKQAHITDGGIRKTTTANMPSVFAWEYLKLKQAIIETMADAHEVLMLYLYDNKTTFPLWEASTAFTMYNKLLIKNGTDFNQYYKLYQPLRTYYNMRELILDAQDQVLKNGLGADLLQYFITLVAPTPTETKILGLLKKSLAFYTIKKACEHLPVQITSIGFTTSTGTADEESSQAQASPALMDLKIRSCEREAMYYLSEAKTLIVAYAAGDPAGVPAAFTAAFDEGPLPTRVAEADVDKGNGTRKIFRF